MTVPAVPTTRALQCYVAVLDHGSVTAAADRLHLSQSALSHQLASLERMVGAPLLERLPRGVRPTVAGRALEAEARAALAAAAAVVRRGRAAASGSVGQVRIACADSLTAPLLAPVLADWRRRHPGVDVDLAELSSADAIAERVRGGEADLGVSPRPSAWDGRLVLIGREPVGLVLPGDHELAAPGAARTMADVARHPVVGFAAGNGLAAWAEDLAAAAGVRLEIAVRSRSAASAAALAWAGLGVAMVPASALPQGWLPGPVHPLDPAVERDLVALTAGGQDPLVRALVADLVSRGAPGLPA